MLIAKEKIKSNITEYLIYMFQIENLIRACDFNKEQIEQKLVNQYQVDEPTRHEIKTWYLGLLELMEEERLEKEGHLQFLENKMTELFDFHLYLIQSDDHPDYKLAYQAAENLLILLSRESKEKNNVVKIALDSLYRISLLKMTGKDIPKDTLQSISKISAFLRLLSKKFSKYEKGKLIIE